MNTRKQHIRKQILQALSHEEAEEGLFFSNLYYLHEEDERPGVEGTEAEIEEALSGLVAEKKVLLDEFMGEKRYRLKAQ